MHNDPEDNDLLSWMTWLITESAEGRLLEPVQVLKALGCLGRVISWVIAIAVSAHLHRVDAFPFHHQDTPQIIEQGVLNVKCG